MLSDHKSLRDNSISIALFLFVYYAVTNNNTVKPLTKPIPKKWSIEKAQSPLLFGLASHNYLILRNDEGYIEKELHGLPETDDGSLIKVALTSGKKLKVNELTEPLYGTRDGRPSAVTVFSGERAEVIRKWKEGVSCAETINKKNIPYPALGVNIEDDTINSNSVATTLLTCMHLPSPKVGLLTPGSQNLIISR